MFSFSAKPTITYDDKYKDVITVKAGSKVSIDTTISGVPTPTSAWRFKDAPLDADKNVQPEAQPTYGRLTIHAAERGNAAEYTLTAENEVGKADATFTLVVKGTNSCNVLSVDVSAQKDGSVCACVCVVCVACVCVCACVSVFAQIQCLNQSSNTCVEKSYDVCTQTNRLRRETSAP